MPGSRCGGAVVLAVTTDRQGRLWRLAEICSRCAASVPDCRVLATAPTPAPVSGSAPEAAPSQRPGVAPGGFIAPTSDRAPQPHTLAARTNTRTVVRPRAARRAGKIAQRTIPANLTPSALRDELLALGDEFRAYQSGEVIDLEHLAALHERKAVAFGQWADVAGDVGLRAEASRARDAARTTREMHQARRNREVHLPGPAPAPDADPTTEAAVVVKERLLTAGQGRAARGVLAYLTDRRIGTTPEARLVALMFTLRSARGGIGNIVGQDLTSWRISDPLAILAELQDTGWLQLTAAPETVLTARAEEPVQITLPDFLPGAAAPLALSKAARPRISGWAQRIVSDKKMRKKNAPAAARLLALYTAAHARSDGQLAAPGLPLTEVATFCALDAPGELTALLDPLADADWLTGAESTDGHLRGQLTGRTGIFVPTPES